MSPIGSELPGEKKFMEITTGETLIITCIGFFAAKKGGDKFLKLDDVS